MAQLIPPEKKKSGTIDTFLTLLAQFDSGTPHKDLYSLTIQINAPQSDFYYILDKGSEDDIKSNEDALFIVVILVF